MAPSDQETASRTGNSSASTAVSSESAASAATSPGNETVSGESKAKGRQIYKMKVELIRDHTPRIRELHLRCDDPSHFVFRAGQFAMLHVPAEPKPLLRAYSMASGEQQKDGIRLIFNYVDGGAASQYVWSLKGGEILDFTGPFGRLFFKEPPTEQIVFLNTGSGVSQHVCYLESLVDRHPELKYRMLFGMRTENDIYLQKELKQLQAKLKDFQFEYVLSRASDSWTGKRGYVQNHIETFRYLEVPTTFYLCGNGAMIKDVKARLAEQGFDPQRILAEAFD